MSWSRRNMLICLISVSVSALLAVGCSSLAMEAQRRSDYVDAHPEIPELMAQSILDGQILVGMDQSMVTATWGKPVRVGADEFEGEPMTVWIYGNAWASEPVKHLFFNRDDILVKYDVRTPLMASPGTVTGKVEKATSPAKPTTPVKDTP